MYKRQPNDQSLQNHGVMNEGEISTQLGLKGIPSLAEEMMLDRDLNICDYTKSKIHFSYLSTKKSIEKVKLAKSQHLDVSCDVALHNIFLTEKSNLSSDSVFNSKDLFINLTVAGTSCGINNISFPA